jgi:hypothetical protein
MLPHVELNRTFWRLGDTEEHDPERLKAYAAFGLEGEDWTKLLERSRVVILAEAGTGKTHELRETARRLRAEGKASFFCRFDDLAEVQLADALEEGNINEFNVWLSGEEKSWFFIDSVDEARLKDSRHFERALRTIARSLGDGANRAHIFISARVSDWRATADLSLVTRWLPPHPAKEETDQETDGSEQPPENRVSIVQLAPLTSDRMRRFAALQGVQDAELFMNTVERADAEVFAERPQDLLELIAYWREHGAIASHADLIDFNIRSKLAEPNPDRNVARPLASARALEGATSLAAALTFTRKSSIIVPDQPVDPDRAAASIEANGVLPDWDGREIDALLNRALFDEATYGRVRFHHRSIQEYLTARWLYGLLNDGKPRRAIEGLLFAARYDIDLVVPSMRPVAAWMALWDDRIRDRIIAVAPEVLLEHGDPSSLPVNVRSQLLRTFADLNRGRSHMDASFDLASIRRLADSQLASTVLELLEQHRANEDLRQLLLGIIWQGQITDCAESALSFALDPSVDPHTRVFGIRAVAAAGNENLKRRLADMLLTRPAAWSNRELGAGVTALYPETFTLKELLEIVEGANPPEEYSVDPIDQALEKIVTRDLQKSQQLSLLVGLIDLLEREPHIRHCGVSERYSWLIPHAAKLAKQIIVGSSRGEVDFPAAVFRIIEMDTEADHYFPRRKSGEGWNGLIGKMPSVRSALFWRATERQRQELEAKGERLTEWWRVGLIVRDLELVSTRHGDFNRFLGAVLDRDNLDDRLVALTAAFAIWRDAGRPRTERERMWRAVKGERELEARLNALLHPGPMTDELKRWRRQERDFKNRNAKRRQQEEEALSHLAKRLAGSANGIRTLDKKSKDQYFSDLFWLARRIAELEGSRSKWGSNRWDLLEADLGRAVAEAAREGLMRFWRLYEPPLPSESNGSGRTNGVLTGLAGLAIEAHDRAGWVRRLSAGEARIAARYAMHEMNGLPDWAPDLIAVHPEAFDAVVIPELMWELSLPADKPEPHHMVSTLRYGSQQVRERYRPLILELLEKHEPARVHVLETALSILLQWEGLDLSRFAELARHRYEASRDEGRHLTWLVAWMCVDAGSALSSLQAWLAGASDLAEADAKMIAFCDALMSHHEIRFGSIRRDFERVEVLRELVPLIYRHVRIEEDNVHEGAYSPNARDDAETTRGYLLGRVAYMPGREAFETLITFWQELPNQWSRDRMLVLARRRAAEDAEQDAWAASDVSNFAKEAEKDPRSARDLFDLACSRLDDLKLDLEEGDASEAAILRRVDQETELRNWFANRLRQASRGRYSVPPEEELADAKRPDLRLHASPIDAPVAIELKIADKWSYSQLVDRLQNQLVGQYLRDARSRFGIFLLVWRGPERWRTPDTGSILSFSQLAERLQVEARAILQERHDLEEIKVVGIDLTRRHTLHHAR